MKFYYKRRLFKRITLAALIAVLLGFTLIFVVCPIAFRLSPSLQKHFLFLNLVHPAVDFKAPAKVGLLGGRNLFVNSSDGAQIGVWHILPAVQLPALILESAAKGEVTSETYDNYLRDGNPIFIYVHGNSGNRGSGHRVELYKVFQKNNYHVIAFDYRSYGDSSNIQPSEEGVVNDTRSVFEWVKSKSNSSRIFVWGHSLGTSISSHTVKLLESEGHNVTGLILESPFNNIREELREYPMAKLFRWLPWFDYFITEPIQENNLRFQTDEYLILVKAPIMILHAEDDFVVPFKLGRKLYQGLKRSRGDNQILRFVPFDKKYKYGHKYICRDPQLPSLLKTFVEDSTKYMRA